MPRTRATPPAAPRSAPETARPLAATPIVLPWAVLVGDNDRHGVIGGRILLTVRYRSALAAATLYAQRQWRPRAAFTGPVHVTATFHEPDRRRRDIANLTKLLGDALTGVAYVDDSQIDRWTLVRGTIDRRDPCAVLVIDSNPHLLGTDV